MLSLIDSALSVAACDQSAIDPFDAVAGGPLSSLEQMWLAERFVRTVVLHDEVVHYIEPLPAFYPGTNIQPLRLQDGRVQVGQWII